MERPGLRERKKARTRAELQRHALRLFRDRGYAATTVDDIAAAAEVSRSTFFRYYPSKEAVVFLFDAVDPLIFEAVAAQPPGTPLLVALRTGLREAFAGLGPEQRELEEVRMELARTVPEIAEVLRQRGAAGVNGIATLVASWFGLDPDGLEVRLFAGVMVGARLAAQSLVADDPGRSYIDTLDEVLGRLVAGIPLVDLPMPAHPPLG